MVQSFTAKITGTATMPHGQVLNALLGEQNVQHLYEVQRDFIAFGETCRHVILKAGQQVLLFREAFGEGMLSAKT